MPEKISQERLDRDFNYHRPDAEKAKKHGTVRDACKVAAGLIVELCPPGRETSLAVTKLEEAMMWANAGLARDPEGSLPS